MPENKAEVEDVPEVKEKPERVEFQISDLGFAAFLKMKGFEVKDIGKDKRNQFQFTFLVDSTEDMGKWKVEYINSESRQFDSNIRLLKLMLRDQSSRG